MKVFQYPDRSRLKGIVLFALLAGALSLFGTLAGCFHEYFSFMREDYVCPFRVITGYPCGTCGSTRMFIRLGRGDIPGALVQMPLAFVLTLIGYLLGLYAVGALFRWWPVYTIDLTGKEKIGFLVGLILLYFLNWGYLILSGR